MTEQPKDMVRTGLFVNQLADWPNDDLLIGQEFRTELQKDHPAIFNVLDWPELRDAFRRHEGPARRGKRISHIQGVLAIAFAGIGVILIGTIPALPHSAERILSICALSAMCIGGLLGLLHWLMLQSKFNWLGNRFWTERLRQLYFQSMVNNLALTARAITDKESLNELKALRRKWFDEFYIDPQDPSLCVREIIQDHAEGKTWLRPEWRQHHPARGNADEIEALLKVLCRQRIHVQHHYAGKNLGRNLYSPGTRANILHFVSQLSNILVVFAALLGVIGYLLEIQIMGESALAWSAVAAVLGAISLTARAINEGLKNESDAERYQWYKETIEELKDRYERETAVSHRVQEFRRLEEISYQELRRFLRTHDTAQFLM